MKKERLTSYYNALPFSCHVRKLGECASPLRAARSSNGFESKSWRVNLLTFVRGRKQRVQALSSGASSQKILGDVEALWLKQRFKEASSRSEGAGEHRPSLHLSYSLPHFRVFTFLLPFRSHVFDEPKKIAKILRIWKNSIRLASGIILPSHVLQSIVNGAAPATYTPTLTSRKVWSFASLPI